MKLELCQTRLPEQFVRTKQSAVTFVSDMGQMAPLMGVGEDWRHNYFVLDDSFKHFYNLTCDHFGEVLSRIELSTLFCRIDADA